MKTDPTATIVNMKIRPLTAILLATISFAWLAAAQDDTPNAPAPAADAAAPATLPEVAKPEPPVAPPPADTTPVPTNGLVLNFHDVPLNTVLNYLSKEAGLIIVSDVNLNGRVSVVSLQPITTNDIIDLLNDQLAKNNASAVLNNRTLTIMSASSATTYNGTPVQIASGGYLNITNDDTIVTEILPLHTLQAQQLVRDLSDLIPRNAIVTPSEAGNSIIMTAPRKDVRRIDNIINDLDGSAISEVQVFKMSYADSKAVSDELKEVFQTEDSQISRANMRNNFMGGGGGGRGNRGGGGGGGAANALNPLTAMFGGAMMGAAMGGGGGGGAEASKNVQTKAVFVADDSMNAVIASAPPDYMVQISNVIAMLDLPSQEITVLRVFHLEHADPGEVSDELNMMFSTGTTDQSGRTPGMQRMGGGGGAGGGFGGIPGGAGGAQAANAQSPRMKRELMVVVVPDRRTQSVIVSASKDMMEQIQGVVEDLDKGGQGNKHVSILDFAGADPETVQLTMAAMFMTSTASRSSSSTTQTATPIGNRYTGNANAQSTTAQNQATSSASMGTAPK
jgi:type II secretory pathway component GspD/PulD (secretin)